MGRITEQDPTGQKTQRARATTSVNVRLRRAERQVKGLYRQLPEEPTTEDMISLKSSVRFILNEQLLETQNDIPAIDWYWIDQIELPYRQGALQETIEINKEIAALAAAGAVAFGLPVRQVTPQDLTRSVNYVSSFTAQVADNFNTFQGLSEKTTQQVINRINSGIQAGATKASIVSDITERFRVSRSDAKRIAHTEVNKAYNDARIVAIDVAAAQIDRAPKVEHISALIPTTRESHARRHGHIYTTKDQQVWWSKGANRINCYCSIRAHFE